MHAERIAMPTLKFKLLVALFLSIPATQLSADEPPNVLFIAVDDLNDWIGCLKGHPQALTPNIDRLAKRGTLFTNAHCAAPACNPSRAAVFSGLTPRNTGVWANRKGKLDEDYPQAKLLPTAFGEAGYKTLGTGKLFHTGGKSTFQEYFTVGQRWSPFPKNAVRYTPEELPSKGTNNPRHVVKDSHGKTHILPLNRMPSDRKPNETDGESFDWGPFDVPDSDFGDTQITDWAIKQLETSEADKLFLAVGYYRPHIPMWGPKRFFDRFKDQPGMLPEVIERDLEDLSPIAKQWAIEAVTAGRHDTTVKHKQWQAAVESYLACVTYIDQEVGRLLDALDASKFANDTAVILWSDHGWHLGEKQHWGKWTGWERSTRVPLIIAPPAGDADHYQIGARDNAPVSLLDLYPTLAELCALQAPKGLAGNSLVKSLRTPTSKSKRVVTTFFDEGNVSLRSQRHRYIRYADGTEELYDLVADPHEWHNLIYDPAQEKTLLSMRELAQSQ